MPFAYPVSSINKDNYTIVTYSGEDVIQVPDAPILEYFYYILPNPVSNGNSKLGLAREAVDYIMNGMLPLIDGGFSYIRLPEGFEVDTAERWWLGVVDRGYPIDRAIDYKERVDSDEENITHVWADDWVTLANSWNTKINELLIEKYP